MPRTPSQNDIAAVPKTKSKKDVEGFDAAAEILSQRFYAQIINKKSTPSAAGAANNAFKELKTTFTASLKPSKSKPPPATISQPTTISQSQSAENENNSSPSILRRAIATPSTTRSSRSTSSSLASASPLDVHNFDPNPHDDGTVYTPVSSVNRGMQRIKFPKILRLRVGNSFTLVIPPIDRKEPKEAVKYRKLIHVEFRRVLLARTSPSMSAKEKDEFVLGELDKRSFLRGGKFITSSMFVYRIMHLQLDG